MKKTFVAVAALTVVGATFAQNSITLSGNIDGGFKATTTPTVAGGSSASKTEFNINNSSTSLLLFKGTRDLPQGLKAGFLLELDFNVTQATTTDAPAGTGSFFSGTPFNGEQYISLSGAFGDLKLGVPNAAVLIAGVTAQPFGTAMASGYSGLYGRLGTAGLTVNQFMGNGNGRVIRHEKTIMYTTPTFSGFTANAEYSPSNDNSKTATANNEQYTSASITYKNGPLTAMYAYANVKVGANGVPTALSTTAISTGGVGFTNGGQKLVANSDVGYGFLAVNYKIGDATVYGGYTTTKSSATPAQEDASSWNIAGKYAVTSDINVMANYLRRTSNLPTGLPSTLIGLGADYMFDKNTNMYVRYENYDLNTNGTTVGGSTTSGFAVGVKYVF